MTGHVNGLGTHAPEAVACSGHTVVRDLVGHSVAGVDGRQAERFALATPPVSSAQLIRVALTVAAQHFRDLHEDRPSALIEPHTVLLRSLVTEVMIDRWREARMGQRIGDGVGIFLAGKLNQVIKGKQTSYTHPLIMTHN